MLITSTRPASTTPPAIDHQPNRSQSTRQAGANAMTSRYAARNQVGMRAICDRICTRSGVTPAASRMTHAASQTSSSGISGRPRRRSRARSQPPYPMPLRRADRQDRPLAYPPTRKNTGITWNTQVSGCDHGALSSTPCGWMPSGSTATIVQCPSTTTVMAAARRKSMTRCREAGVAAATRSARDISGCAVGMEVMVPPSRGRGASFVGSP